MSFVDETSAGRVVFGAGARHRIADELEALGVSRVLLVVSPSSRTIADEVEASLGGRVVGRWSDLAQHVPVAKATEARRRAAELAVDATLTIGGGTAIGFGKAIALEVPVPQVAVPTTYAGSEMTPFWGLSDGTRKWTGRDPTVQPRVVVYDPELTLGLAPHVSATSGMNALAHAVAALDAPGASPASSALALEAARILSSELESVVRRPEDLEARTEVLAGAHLAARALGIAGTGPHHVACHVLGGSFGLDHGGTHAVLLPHAMRWRTPAPEARDRLGDALGSDEPARALADLARALEVPRSLAEIGMPAPPGDPLADPVVRAIVESTQAIGREQGPEIVGDVLRDAHRGAPPPAA